MPVLPKQVHEVLSRYMLADGLDLVLDLDKSRGALLHDSLHGRDYLDLFSFYASMPVGFNHPRLRDAEFLARLGRVGAYKPSNPDIYTPELAEFVETFARVATRGLFQYHFFVEGGALGVENALKVAFDWKARRNQSAGKPIGALKVIHFREAFHGRSGYTLSLTNTADPRKYELFPKFDWPRISNPKVRFPLNEENLAAVVAAEQQSLREIDAVIAQGADDIACLIVEPIQAEGGDHHFRTEFLRELRQRADDHNFLLIFDEVQTGGGLTGTMWAFEQLGVQPDLVSFGKKFQVCGCLSTKRIDDVDHVFRVSSRINSTFGGNLTDMVRCQRYLEIIEEEKLVENAQRVGSSLLEGFHSLAKRHEVLRNVRGRGLFISFDLPTTEQRDALRLKMRELGALIISCGTHAIRLRPVLDLSQNDATRALELFDTALRSF
jgi:L-lysine 6-transaminase